MFRPMVGPNHPVSAHGGPMVFRLPFMITNLKYVMYVYIYLSQFLVCFVFCKKTKE